ncbi:hypothetical protein [Pseudomonas sp. RW10S2]|uniref:hypothetical protein n=1 Tax=Pseudomonas sp. RW10S2 TaxID=459637 RepID=UPI001647F971|nr:hypothetical protein [Pseudomonas sp. RW10S2]MBC3468115.1 hypothetical protein [Pseudomonas sp. RW10S2]
MSTYNPAASFIAVLSCETSKGSGTLTAGKLKGAKSGGGYYGNVDVDRRGDVYLCSSVNLQNQERFWFGCFNRGEPERYDVRSWAPGKPHHGQRLAVASDGSLRMVPAVGISCDWLLSWDGKPLRLGHVNEMGGPAYGFAMSHVTAGGLRHEAPTSVRTGWHNKMRTGSGEQAGLWIQIQETWVAQP